MTVVDLVRDYGYWAIAVGTFFEGEMIMLAAGVAAQSGLLGLPGIMIAGMTGIFCSDSFCFFVGRWMGNRIGTWFPRLHSRLERALQLIERHDRHWLIFFQFLPGLCTVTPMAYGMTKISVGRFMVLDGIGNAAWTAVFCLGGYLFGIAFEQISASLHQWESVVMIGATIVAATAWLIGRRWAKRLASVV